VGSGTGAKIGGGLGGLARIVGKFEGFKTATRPPRGGLGEDESKESGTRVFDSKGIAMLMGRPEIRSRKSEFGIGKSQVVFDAEMRVGRCATRGAGDRRLEAIATPGRATCGSNGNRSERTACGSMPATLAKNHEIDRGETRGSAMLRYAIHPCTRAGGNQPFWFEGAGEDLPFSAARI
jgi:hypothetical protein